MENCTSVRAAHNSQPFMRARFNKDGGQWRHVQSIYRDVNVWYLISQGIIFLIEYFDGHMVTVWSECVHSFNECGWAAFAKNPNEMISFGE